MESRRVVLLLATLSSLCAFAAAIHNEELRVRPLPRVSKVLTHFRFSTDEEDGHAVESSIPNVIRHILEKYDAASLHLSFGVGRYTDARYGPAHAVGETVDSFHAPYGTRLQVEFNGNETSPVVLMERWKGVTSELGGIFSASLNQMDETTVTTLLASSSSEELGAYATVGAGHNPTQFWQASLPREEFCTENLAPWLKMLPCRAHAGFGALIDPIQVLSSEYLTMSVLASHDRVTGKWKLEQRLTAINKWEEATSRPWTLRSLVQEKTALHACPIAKNSAIVTEKVGSKDVTTTDLKAASEGLGLDAPWIQPVQDGSASTQDLVRVHRFLTGYGQVHGGVAVRLENHDPRCSMQVRYHDVTPWYLRMYFHTFKTQVISLETNEPLGNAQLSSFEFAPAESRGRPNHFQVHLEIPPQSAVVMSVQFDKVFVRLSEHPPDANRGFDIPSGIATVTSGASCASTSQDFTRLLYTEPLLVALPTPDFSMPYNVITLTSTVVVFFAGKMLNTLLRKAPRIQRMLATNDQPKSTT
ncbi:hypothetical protein Poli38472_004285 [Pythium oligandrum]|uniref:GPI transamidase component PIG-T n=1 Tax=Pythium oligandrum TaxID=41045 RepID=A0A8K1CND1_PYTOL|nr:hypothetical protein Poli38472_004285 [Pythium oligandrum]|eukprot:TMW66520.1 hypothetical protein Poli38472_004285 [Pythium oligandrum]